MKSELPPVRQRALEAAREAARRRGVTAGEWLDAAILDSARQQGVEPQRSAHPRYPRRDDADQRTQAPCRSDPAGDRLHGDLAKFGLLLQQALPRRAIEALEYEVRRLADRVESTRAGGVDAAALARVERGVAEMREALRTLVPAESLLGVAQALQQLSHRIDRNATGAREPAALRRIEGALVAVRSVAARVASSDALAKLSDEVRGLAGKIDQIEQAQAARDRQSSLARIEELIAKLAENLDAVHGTLGRVVDRLAMIETGIPAECAQDDARAVPSAAPLAPAGAPMPPPPTPPAEPAAPDPEGAAVAPRPTSQPCAHAASDRDSSEPRLPPDQPPKSGSAAVRSRNPGSPMDRVFNSEAMPGPVKPSADTDCGGKADFIAAARRAVQAAGEQDREQGRTCVPLKILSTAAGPAGRIGTLSALIGVATAVLTVLGGLQIARTLRSSVDAAKVSALGQAAARVSPAPPASAAATIGPPASQESAPGHGRSASVAHDLATPRPAQ